MHGSSLSQVKKRAKLILIDDDRAFSIIMNKFAKAMQIQLDCYCNPSNLEYGARLAGYDGAIINYDIGQFNEFEMNQYFESFFKSRKPFVLISGKERLQCINNWPEGFQGFLHKDSGPQAILDKIYGCLFRKRREQNASFQLMDRI